METFCLPMREIGERFTKSELYMIAWRSQEQHHHIMLKMKKWNKGRQSHEVSDDSGVGSRYGANDIIPEGLPDHFYNKNGEVDLSQVTGKEAFKYMSALGIPFPVINTGKPNPSFQNRRSDAG